MNRLPITEKTGRDPEPLHRLLDAIAGRDYVPPVLDPFLLWPTLDDLFGPDLEAEMRETSRRISALYENRDLSKVECEVYCRAVTLFIGIADEVHKLQEARRRGFWQVFVARPIEGSGPFMTPPGDGKTRFMVYLFPTLGRWMTHIKWSLQDAIRAAEEVRLRAVEEQARLIARFARFVGDAERRALAVILSGLALVRGSISIFVPTRAVLRTLRDLIGELLSPSVQAAGGGPGLFVIRC